MRGRSRAYIMRACFQVVYTITRRGRIDMRLFPDKCCAARRDPTTIPASGHVIHQRQAGSADRAETRPEVVVRHALKRICWRSPPV